MTEWAAQFGGLLIGVVTFAAAVVIAARMLEEL